MSITASATPAETASPRELSLEEALAFAVHLLKNLQIEGAEQLLSRILALRPDHADVLHLLGMARNRLGRSEEALALIKQAIVQTPDFAGFHNNLGNIHVERGELDAATRCYQRAAELAPNEADLHNNLGALYKAQQRFAEAEAAYQRAIALNPEHINAHNNLGLLFAAQGRSSEAIQYYCQSIALMPNHPDGHRLLGMAYYSLRKIPEAAEVFRQWLEKDPQQPVAKHMYAACSGIGVPERAADDYVEEMFDRFSSSFEEQLQNHLQYKAPERVVEALKREAGASLNACAVLDAGCGTGLCGPLVRDCASHLLGVDLSLGMLEKAAQKACYDQLEKAELSAWLSAHPAAYDVIISADTLVYFGPLEAFMDAACAALRPGGWLAFSLERADAATTPAGYRINPHGRYSHTRAYLEKLAATRPLQVRSIDEVVLRTEGGEPVQGQVVVLQRNISHPAAQAKTPAP